MEKTRCVVWYHGTVWWVYYMAKYCLVVWYVSVYRARRSRMHRTRIICNDLIHRSLERIRKKYKVCGHTNRQTDFVINYRNRYSELRESFRFRSGMLDEPQDSLRTVAPRGRYTLYAVRNRCLFLSDKVCGEPCRKRW